MLCTRLQIIDNYVGQSNDAPPFANADDAFRIYNAEANYDSRVPGEHYYDFRYGDVAFFVMDTRRHRSDPLTGEAAARTMLGETQLSALYEWLGKVCPRHSLSPTSRLTTHIQQLPF
jgi:alkaline phosphatase D